MDLYNSQFVNQIIQALSGPVDSDGVNEKVHLVRWTWNPLLFVALSEFVQKALDNFKIVRVIVLQFHFYTQKS